LQDDGSWLQVAGPQFSPTFSDLPHDTYRAKVERPSIAENECGEDRFGNIIKGRKCVFNTSGQFLGFVGTFDNTPFGNQFPIFTTNTVIVGETVDPDVSYTFIDLPETGSESAYDFGEIALMDASNSENYNLWWLSIFEDGPTFDRYKSNGWTDGTISTFNLSEFWGATAGWDFEEFHSYAVQFAVQNRQCRLGGWANLNRTFFICPAGTGCKFGIEEKEISVSPNPAINVIELHNFVPSSDKGYIISIADMSGRIIMNTPLTSDIVDISNLANGMFIVSILNEKERVFTSKLIVEK